MESVTAIPRMLILISIIIVSVLIRSLIMGQFFYTTLSGTPFVDSDRIVLFITFLYSIYSIMATNN